MNKNPWDKQESSADNRNNHLNDSKSNKKDVDLLNIDYWRMRLKLNSNKSLFLFLFLITTFLYIFSGFYSVDTEQEAIVMRFGKYIRKESSGLHYKFPYPVEVVKKYTTKRVLTLKVGSDDSRISNYKKVDSSRATLLRTSSNFATKKNQNDADLMLTGDENIVDMNFVVQWKISNIEDFVFKISDPVDTLFDVSQSVIREIISRSVIDFIFTNGRGSIEVDAKKEIQGILDFYNSGIEIVMVQMLKVDPPVQVITSFRDVQNARVDKESTINRALSYENDVVPKARGEAKRVLEEAFSYDAEVVNRAKGDAQRFDLIRNSYMKNPSIVKKEMYINALSATIGRTNKTIIDSDLKNPIIINGSSFSNNDKSDGLKNVALFANENVAKQ
jgi:membrane protease subunit HflK